MLIEIAHPDTLTVTISFKFDELSMSFRSKKYFSL